jgi:alpha-tubulin suppressor-like RCC1 family protein
MMNKTSPSKKVETLVTLKQNKNNVFKYNPFSENDVLLVCYTTLNVIMLLRNGTVVSWGLNRATLGRRCVDSSADSYLSFPIYFPTKIVDIACGRDHCLARGADFKVYSWGFNNYGQVNH